MVSVVFSELWQYISTYLPVDCEQSLFFFTRFSMGSARARERWAVKQRDARNEGGSPRRKKRTGLVSLLCRLSVVLRDVPFAQPWSESKLSMW